MQKSKLKIEVHQKTKNYFKTVLSKKNTIKEIEAFHTEFKKRLKDRHRIKGVFISEPKKDKYQPIKKFQKTIKENIINANITLSNKDYDNIKHIIFCKEKEKEKREKINEKFDENLIKREKIIN